MVRSNYNQSILGLHIPSQHRGWFNYIIYEEEYQSLAKNDAGNIYGTTYSY